jgi:hypothetical protein
MRLNNRFALPLAGLATLALSGCTSIGARGLELSRTAFNTAIQQTDAEQLLLNIVRQRYSDPVMFLEVASISSSMSRVSNLNLTSMIPGGGRPNTYTGVLGGSFTDTPLVIYSPNTGEKFVRQILTPIDLRTISLLLQAGWSIERVLLVAGESFAGLSNSTTAAADYRTLVDHLRTLQRSEQLTFAFEIQNKVDTLVMTPAAPARETTAYKEACRLMNIPADGRPISVRLGVGEKFDDAQVSLGTRSLYASFYFLANGVEPPTDDLQTGVLQRRRLEGGAFDGGGDLFRIRTSSQRPQDATVKVRYRDQWFYIAATDPDTRTTFSLLSMMLTLQSGDSTRLTPLISVSSGP